MANLKIIAISGTTDVTQNCYVYEYGNEMIVLDCGVGFPDPEMYGVDLVIPDFSYILENRDKLKAVIVTHGHEDHLGALPFLLNKLSVPIYSTKLVAGFIEDKFKDYGMRTPKITVFDLITDVLTIGSFKLTPFRISHSVPDAAGFCIDTPSGKVFHVPDYKFDWTPVDGKPFDIKKAALLASDGAVALLSDCLGSNSPGYTESEIHIEQKIKNIVEKVKGQIFFTTISSNISRMQQALWAAQANNRKVCFIGRSIDHKAEIAKRLGYLSYDKNLVVDKRTAQRLPANQIMYIVSGCYGQPGSALYRICTKDHEWLNVNKEDVVVFSADPSPPGSKVNVDFMVDRLTEIGAEVHYYDTQEDLHVSGHGSQLDIQMLMSLISPKYLIPIGGTIRHMRAYSKLAEELGYNREDVLELKQGDVVEFAGGNAQITDHISVKNVLVDGLGIGDVGNVVLRDRQTLAKDGIAIIMVQVDKDKRQVVDKPEIISRGFVFETKSADFLDQASEDLFRKLKSLPEMDAMRARNLIIDFLEKYFYEKIKRRPMVLPLIVEV